LGWQYRPSRRRSAEELSCAAKSLSMSLAVVKLLGPGEYVVGQRVSPVRSGHCFSFKPDAATRQWPMLVSRS
jgi:hypothetical protein